MLASTLSGFMFASLQQVTTTGFVPPEDDDIVDFLYLLTVTVGGKYISVYCYWFFLLL